MYYSREVLICLIAFIYSLEAGLSGSKPVAAADKLAEDTVYSIPSGETAKIFSRRSNREELTEFKEYRVWKDNVTFAIITNLTVTATCPDNVLQQFCLTKIEFKIWNVTHLILKVKNTTHDDSGNYFVEHVFGGMEGNHRDKIILNIEASPTGTTLSQGITTEDNKLSSSIGLPSSTTSKSSAVSSGGISFSRAAWSLLLLLLLCVFIKVNSVDLI